MHCTVTFHMSGAQALLLLLDANEPTSCLVTLSHHQFQRPCFEL